MFPTSHSEKFVIAVHFIWLGSEEEETVEVTKRNLNYFSWSSFHSFYDGRVSKNYTAFHNYSLLNQSTVYSNDR